jgi:hypothetical protein
LTRKEDKERKNRRKGDKEKKIHLCVEREGGIGNRVERREKGKKD